MDSLAWSSGYFRVAGSWEPQTHGSTARPAEWVVATRAKEDLSGDGLPTLGLNAAANQWAAVMRSRPERNW
jgi:hypothetical protein